MLEQDYTCYDTSSSKACDPNAPCVYFVNMHAHPMDLTGLAERFQLNVVSFYVSDWDADLSPWPAPGLYKGDPDFAGDALTTLHLLESQLIPAIEAREQLAPRARAIAGYSMGGLFAAYAFLRGDLFSAMASISGSLWYERWPEFIDQKCAQGAETHAFEGKFAYFSIGSKERRSPPKILSSVEQRARASAEKLKAAGATTQFVRGPGNHHQHVLERCQAALASLEGFFCDASVS